MSRIAILIAALCLAIAPVAAQQMSLTGAGKGSPTVALTITQIAECQDTGSDDSLTCNTTVDVAAGETIFLVFTGRSSTISVISDGTANAYTTGASVAGAASAQTMYILNPLAVASGSTYTVTTSVNDASKNFSAWKLNRTATHGTFGTGNATSTAPSCVTSGSLASGVAVVGVIGANSASTLSSPGGIWTEYYNAVNNARVQMYAAGLTTGSGTVTFSSTLGESKEWACAVDSFQ